MHDACNLSTRLRSLSRLPAGCSIVAAVAAKLICSCCSALSDSTLCRAQILQFGLYEFVTSKENPSGKRVMKKGTEVIIPASHHTHDSMRANLTMIVSRLYSEPGEACVCSTDPIANIYTAARDAAMNRHTSAHACTSDIRSVQ